MKKLTGIICGIMMLAGSSLYAEAPIAAGTLELGIGKVVSYDRMWNDDMTFNQIVIGTYADTYDHASADFSAPVFGIAYFVADGLALGLNAGFYYYKNDQLTNPSQGVFVAPGIKFYVPLSEGLLVDAHGSFGYFSSDDGALEQETTGMTFELGLGLNILVTQQFAVVLGFDYTYMTDYEVDGEKVADTAMSGIGVSLGFKTFISMNQ
ncbi:MAG TPA: hypothetical protein PK514_02230 [Spirochaetota bacterium]|nr:hypothetical protein [Spirochaetota bacterium]